MSEQKEKDEARRNHKKLVRDAKQAIEKVFKDKSVSEKQTVRSLEEIAEKVELCTQAMF